MDQKQIERLMNAMEQSRIKRVMIKREGFEIEIERECSTPFPSTLLPQAVLSAPPGIEHPSKSLIENISPIHPEIKEHSNDHYVTSPMVGTFYAASSPDQPSFVKVGDFVNENSIVCIIEAMKVMNEVKAGIKGTVTEVLSKSGEPVEFGTRIFKIHPS